MTVTTAGASLAHATLDRDERLLSADPALEALNARAGGSIGAPLAVPQLATLARLARRLGIVVSRGVVVADHETDISLWVRVQPQDEGLRLAVSGWRERHAWRPAAGAEAARRDLAAIDGDWRWETDAALRVTFVSPEEASRWGIDPIAVLGRPLTALFSFADEVSKGALAERRPLTAAPATVRGSNKGVLLFATVRYDSDGGFAGYAGAVRKREQAAGVSPPLSEIFVGRLGEALRTPLGRIIANADTIHAQAEGPVQADYVDYAADIANAGRHLLSLIDDLVDVQGIERPDFTPALEPIDLADLARRAAGLLAVRASNAGTTIKRPPPAYSLPAVGDYRRTLQILVNLIGNAVRYAPPGGVVDVSLGSRPGFATVCVADTGKGIAPEDQERIFDKFERVDASEPGGNGLGLYIARRLAAAMGGVLTVESTPGAGACFTLSLPQSPADPLSGDAARGEDQQ